MQNLLMIGILIDIALLIYIARSANRGLKFLLYTLCGYWFLSFFLRPLLFIYSRDHNINSAVYDSRIGLSQNNFIHVMYPIVLGCFTFCLPLIFQKLKINSVSESLKKMSDSRDISWILLYGTICGLVAAIVENTPYRNPISKSLVGLIPFCFCAYLWKRKVLDLSKLKQVFLIFTALISILLLATNSGHFKGILLTPLLVFFFTLSIWENRNNRFHKTIVILFTVLVSIPLFTALQSRKLGAMYVVEFNAYSDLLPWFFSPFLTLCVRFDQFPRAADAYFAGSGVIGGFDGWIKHILVNLEWNPSSGRDAPSFGNAWNQLVTNRSIPGARFSPVSLAQGMIGEGLIWAGSLSLVIECLIVSFIFIWVGRLLDRGVLATIFAFGIIGNSTMFEAGSVQISGSISGAVKILIFLWISLKVTDIRRKKPWELRLNE